MIYTGTKKQCEAYNDLVTAGEQYQGTTTHWANIRKHPTKDLWCIPKHDDYESDLTLVDFLPADWFENLDEE